MPPSKTKSHNGAKRGQSGASVAELPDVLTLSEAAALLRVSKKAVEQSVADQGLPGRRIGGEWRFFKTALENWLGSVPKPVGNEALLKMAGAFKDDPFLEEIVRETYEKRGRPMTEKAG